MKFFKIGLIPFTFCCILFLSSAPFSSCTKTETVRDTVRITVRDTIIKKDTVTIVDSINCNCYNLKDGLVAWYNFNSATLKDSSGNNNHISFNNATVVADRFGKANNAYSFNGTSNYMRVENSVSLNPANKNISLMAIVNVKGFYDGNCNANQIFGKGYNDFINGFYYLRFGSVAGCGNPIDPTRVLFGGAYGDNNKRTAIGDVNAAGNYIQTNTWYNIIFTVENGVSKIYINGVLKNTDVANASNVLFTPNNQEMYIGKHGDTGFPFWFNGIIDEIRIYDRALCQGEVNQLNNLNQ